jgi:hypothetical protein
MESKTTLEDKLKSLVTEWQHRQIHYIDESENNIDNEHNHKKLKYKALATRDCWKELLTLIESKEGAKWQQERSYSDEEVLNKLTHFAVEIQRQNKRGVVPLRIKEWFERNKKK